MTCLKAIFFNLVVVSTLILFNLANAEQNKLDVFSLSRSACEGTCPVYQVDVYSDGTMIFDGRLYVSYEGKKEIRLTPEIFKQLKNKFYELYQVSLKQSECIVFDAPSVNLSLNEGGFITKFSHTHGCKEFSHTHGCKEMELKDSLWEMIDEAEGLLSIERLIHFNYH